MKCDVVTDKDKAVQRTRSRKEIDYAYKLCVVDGELSGSDGIETIQAIQDEVEGMTPIIFTTVQDISTIEKQARAAGASQILPKPVLQSTLFNDMVNLFGRYASAKEVEFPKIDFKGMKILLAEDNEMNLEIATEVLRRAGIIVDTVVNGKEAVDMFVASEENTYQVILMDVQMPVMDGYEATRQIRASQHPQAKDIPIIATTANAFSEDVTTAFACGMNGHIAKPIDYKKLYKVFETFSK